MREHQVKRVHDLLEGANLQTRMQSPSERSVCESFPSAGVREWQSFRLFACCTLSRLMGASLCFICALRAACVWSAVRV